MGETREMKDFVEHPLPELTRSVELGKFDPPLWHAPYGRIV